MWQDCLAFYALVGPLTPVTLRNPHCTSTHLVFCGAGTASHDSLVATASHFSCFHRTGEEPGTDIRLSSFSAFTGTATLPQKRLLTHRRQRSRGHRTCYDLLRTCVDGYPAIDLHAYFCSVVSIDISHMARRGWVV